MYARAILFGFIACTIAGCTGAATLAPTAQKSQTVDTRDPSPVTSSSRFKQYKVGGGYEPWSLSAGPNQAMWIPATNTSLNQTKIVELQSDGLRKTYAAPNNVQVAYILEGPDGNLWYTGFSYPNTANNYVTRMTPTGVFAEFPVTKRPIAIALGPNNTVWFTEYDGSGQGTGLVGFFTMQGQLTEYSLNDNAVSVNSIVLGPDGNMWLTESTPSSGAILKVSPQGTVTRYTTGSEQFDPFGCIVSYRGELWFGARNGTQEDIDSMSTDGNITATYPVPNEAGAPTSLVIGSDGGLWFNGVANGVENLVSMPKPGVFHTHALRKSLGGDVGALTLGTDNTIWFIDPVGTPPGVGTFLPSL